MTFSQQGITLLLGSVGSRLARCRFGKPAPLCACKSSGGLGGGGSLQCRISLPVDELTLPPPPHPPPPPTAPTPPPLRGAQRTQKFMSFFLLRIQNCERFCLLSLEQTGVEPFSASPTAKNAAFVMFALLVHSALCVYGRASQESCCRVRV